MNSLLGKLALRARSNFHQANQLREMHSRKKVSMEFVAKGWAAVQEIERVVEDCIPWTDKLIPFFRTARENYELALEADNGSTQVRYLLAKLHLDYKITGVCPAIGYALLTEAAHMGNPDALYELGCHLRIMEDSAEEGMSYIHKAVEQLHPDSLFLHGAAYLCGSFVKQDIDSALWCFHKAAEKGHAKSAIAYGSLLLRGFQAPEQLTKLSVRQRARRAKRTEKITAIDPLEMAKKQFEIAAKAGCDLAFKWLDKIDEQEKQIMREEKEQSDGKI